MLAKNGLDSSDVVTGSPFSGPTADGIVAAWDNTQGSTYITGTATGLSVNPAGSAVWHNNGTESGIKFENGGNIGFYPIAGVTVNASGGGGDNGGGGGTSALIILRTV